ISHGSGAALVYHNLVLEGDRLHDRTASPSYRSGNPPRLCVWSGVRSVIRSPMDLWPTFSKAPRRARRIVTQPRMQHGLAAHGVDVTDVQQGTFRDAGFAGLLSGTRGTPLLWPATQGSAGRRGRARFALQQRSSRRKVVHAQSVVWRSDV